MAATLIASLAFATLACPFLLTYVWIIRLRDGVGEKGLRILLGWISLAAVSCGVAIFWLSALNAPPFPSQEWGAFFDRWSRISVGITVLGFVSGLLDRAKKKWIVMIASFVVPLSWFLTGHLER